jgi:hypothetical protein
MPRELSSSTWPPARGLTGKKFFWKKRCYGLCVDSRSIIHEAGGMGPFAGIPKLIPSRCSTSRKAPNTWAAGGVLLHMPRTIWLRFGIATCCYKTLASHFKVTNGDFIGGRW